MYGYVFFVLIIETGVPESGYSDSWKKNKTLCLFFNKKVNLVIPLQPLKTPLNFSKTLLVDGMDYLCPFCRIRTGMPAISQYIDTINSKDVAGLNIGRFDSDNDIRISR